MDDEKTTNELLKGQLAQLRSQLDVTLLELKEKKLKLKRAEEALVASGNLRYNAQQAFELLEKRNKNSEDSLRVSEELRKEIVDALKLSEIHRTENGKQANITLKLSEDLRNQADEALKISKGLLQQAYDEIAKLNKGMARLDRLDLVGQFAASIGHEIRNPMTTIRGFLQLLREKGEFLKHNGYFDLMIEELDRVNSIITELLSLAKNKVVECKTNNINTIIETLLPLVQADAVRADKFITAKLNQIPDLILDEKEIRQLILNLVRNGLEAMPPKGNLTISTFMDGDGVVMAVKDQGKGIEPEILEKIGTPFITTKDNGTGLGLAICYSIAPRNNAKIDIDTSSSGTTFFVHFKT